MKSALISINPKWCELIANGSKTIEVRKTQPNIKTPFKCYIYCTASKPYLTFTNLIAETGNKQIRYNDNPYAKYPDEILLNGKVIGEFVCDNIIVEYPFEYQKEPIPGAGLSVAEQTKYGNGKVVFCWHISELKIYDKPRELGEFYRNCTDFEQCELCDHYRYKNEYSEYGDTHICDCGQRISIARPPQSWFYVEEETK